SGFTTLTTKRRPADVGFALTTAICSIRYHEVDFLACGDAHVGLLPVLAPRDAADGATHLAAHVQRGDVLDGHLEQLLDGFLDLGLGGVRRHLESVLVRLVAENRDLLGEMRLDQHGVETFLIHASTSSSFFSAPTVTSTFSWLIRLTGSIPWTSRTSTSFTLRADRYRFSSTASA